MCVLPSHGTLHWHHNERKGVANHQAHVFFLLNRLFRPISKKTSKLWKLCVTGLCEGNSPVTGEFPVQKASDAENVSIWRRHQEEDSTGGGKYGNGQTHLMFCWHKDHSIDNTFSNT